MKLPRHVPLVVATRGDTVESVHYGSIAVVDVSGELVWSVGDTAFPIFTRSTLKPFQALPFMLDGGSAHARFSSEQVALMCASHSGEPRHVAAVADMLARIGCAESHLQCGCHVPLFYAATGAVAPPDFVPSPLHHNCSGKHAGFLAWCRQHGESIDNYLDPDHPLQINIRRCLTEISACREDEMPMGIDGCGAPNYALPLPTLARMYARLATHADHTPYDAALATLYTAMTAHPEMVAGEARTDLLLMQAAAGDWVAKGGAEGVQALGIRSHGLGMAIKIADGGTRALAVVMNAVLSKLNFPPIGDALIAERRSNEIGNQAGRLIGRLIPVFEFGH